MIKIPSYFPTFSTSYQDMNIIVHAKFTIVDFTTSPTLYTTTSTTSGNFEVYGSYKVDDDDSKFYISNIQQTITIS